MTKIAKGSLVRLNQNTCFTTKNGGMRKHTMSNSLNDDRGTVEGTRIPSKDDIRIWRNSDASKGMTSGGDTKLPPTCYTASIYKDRVYTVLRARCRGQWSYRTWPGQALVLDTETGHEIYVKRELLELAV